MPLLRLLLLSSLAFALASWLPACSDKAGARDEASVRQELEQIQKELPEWKKKLEAAEGDEKAEIERRIDELKSRRKELEERLEQFVQEKKEEAGEALEDAKKNLLGGD